MIAPPDGPAPRPAPTAPAMPPSGDPPGAPPAPAALSAPTDGRMPADGLPPPAPGHPVGSEAARKALHIAAAVALAAIVRTLPPITARTIAVAAAGIALAIDLGRLRLPAARRAFEGAVGSMLRPPEHGRLTGATKLAIGCAAAVLLFPRPAAIGGVLYAGIADAAGAVAGRAWGRHRYARGRSLEGSAVLLGVAFLLGWTVLALTPARAALAAVALAVVEALPLPIDDNLSLPLTGAALFLLLSSAP